MICNTNCSTLKTILIKITLVVGVKIVYVKRHKNTSMYVCWKNHTIFFTLFHHCSGQWLFNIMFTAVTYRVSKSIGIVNLFLLPSLPVQLDTLVKWGGCFMWSALTDLAGLLRMMGANMCIVQDLPSNNVHNSFPTLYLCYINLFSNTFLFHDHCITIQSMDAVAVSERLLLITFALLWITTAYFNNNNDIKCFSLAVLPVERSQNWYCYCLYLFQVTLDLEPDFSFND